MRLVSTIVGASLALAASVSAAISADPIFRFKILEETLVGCGKFRVNFTIESSKGPWTLTAFPDSNEIFNWTIADGAYEKTPYGGTIELDLPYRAFKNNDVGQTQKIVFLMSDSVNGIASGGVSDILGVKTSKVNDCKYPPHKFNFAIVPDYPTVQKNLTSCSDITLLWGEGGHMPEPFPDGDVTWAAVVPNSGVWLPDANDHSGNFTTNVLLQTGTTFMMGPWDSKGGSGGSLGPITVKDGGSSCLQNGGVINPQTTPLDWDQYISKFKSSSSSSSGLSSGAKIGIGVGVALGVVLLLALLGVIFWLKRKNRLGTRRAGPIDMVDDEPTMSNTQGLDASHIPTPYVAQHYVPSPGTATTDVSEGYTPMLAPDGSETNRSSYLSSTPFNPNGAMAQMAAASPTTMSAAQAALRTKGGRPMVEPTFTYHADGGTIAPPAAVETPANIDVPPTYNPEWSEVGSSNGGNAAAHAAAMPEKGRF